MVEELPAFISQQAFLACPEWVATGWEIWEQLAPWKRDFLLAMPTPDMQAARNLEVKYADAAAMTRALHSELMLP